MTFSNPISGIFIFHLFLRHFILCFIVSNVFLIFSTLLKRVFSMFGFHSCHRASTVSRSALRTDPTPSGNFRSKLVLLVVNRTNNTAQPNGKRSLKAQRVKPKMHLVTSD